MRVARVLPPHSPPAGFTLIELLVVITLILIMFVMVIGPAQKSYQDEKLIACQQNLQMIHLALKIYATDSGGTYPLLPGALTAEAPLSLLVPRCTTETAIFLCPGSPDRRLPEAQSFANRKISYAYYMGLTSQAGADAMLLSDEQIDTQPRRIGEQMFSPAGKRPGNNHRSFGGNLLFGDGHVEQSPPVAAQPFALSNSVSLLNPKP